MILELLYNKKHKCGRFVVENSFNILKKTFRKFFGKINLHVTFVPNVVEWFFMHHMNIIVCFAFPSCKCHV